MWAVVRHYHCHDRDAYYRKAGMSHPPYSYMGLLKASHDLGGNVKEDLRKALEKIPDGEKITITITQHGTSPTAQGFVWAWLRDNEYGRITVQEYEKMVQDYMKGAVRNTYDDIIHTLTSKVK